MREIKKQILSIWYKCSFNQKLAVVFVLLIASISSLFLLPKEEAVDKVVDHSPLPPSNKGYELFDAHTWTKREKELHILEVRALIGQLEQDLSSFEHIQNAHVILDIGETGYFNEAKQKTKASVILTLKDRAQLRRSHLAAISYHLAGAVCGLEPNMVAISDTQGRLYQGFQESCQQDLSAIVDEEKWMASIETLLKKVYGEGHFHMSFQRDQLALLIDKNQEKKCKEIMKHIELIDPKYKCTIDYVTFYKETPPVIKNDEEKSHKWLYTPFLLLFAIPLFFIKFKKVKKTRADKTYNLKDLDKEKPETIARILTHLEIGQAEKMIDCLSENTQKAVLAELNGMDT